MCILLKRDAMCKNFVHIALLLICTGITCSLMYLFCFETFMYIKNKGGNCIEYQDCVFQTRDGVCKLIHPHNISCSVKPHECHNSQPKKCWYNLDDNECYAVACYTPYKVAGFLLVDVSLFVGFIFLMYMWQSIIRYTVCLYRKNREYRRLEYDTDM